MKCSMANNMSKNWVLTINNYTDVDIACFKRDENLFTYWGYALEVGEGGTPHIQGFVCLKSRSRRGTVSKLFPRARVEKMGGNISQNQAYCSKAGDLIEYGTPPMDCGTKEKVRWKEVWESMKKGDVEAIPEDIRVRYYSTMKAIAKDYMPKPDMLDDVCGTWIWGEPGCGKSFAVVSQHPQRYIKPINKWWDGYQKEEVVHIDELDPSHSTWISPFLKKWADRYPFDAEIKGGAMQIRPKRIIVTSNYRIEDMGFDPVTVIALNRRFISINKIINQNIIL